MKKRALAIFLAAIMALSLASCGDSETNEPDKTPPASEPAEKTENPVKEAPELTGEWKQTNSNSEDTYQAIYISDTAIEVYWIMGEDTTALYWAGTYDAPETGDEPYTWTSKNDKDRTSTALLASTSDTKEFTYKDGKISYTASALGETVTVEAEKQSWGYSDLQSSEEKGQGSVEGAGDLGNYHVEIKDAFLAKDYEGNPAMVVTYSWTNNSEDTTSAMTSVAEKAFQDGVQLDTALLMDVDGFESGTSMTEVRPGTTIDIQCAFLLTSDTSIVEFEITEWISFSDDMVTMNFDPSNL